WVSKMKRKHDLIEPDVFDVLSATWVFSCNDENPIITFEGVKHRLGRIITFEGVKYRLGLTEWIDIRGLVKSRADLFRLGVPPDRLERWKAGLRKAVQTQGEVPSWIRDLPN